MINHEPSISVGLMTGARQVRFELKGRFAGGDEALFEPGSYLATPDSSRVLISDFSGRSWSFAPEFRLRPAARETSFLIHDVIIGGNFHWERREVEEFQGSLCIRLVATSLIVINEILVESYLQSVISSEMSAGAHPELLKAHSIISRSWLLAQAGERSGLRTPDSDPLVRPGKSCGIRCLRRRSLPALLRHRQSHHSRGLRGRSRDLRSGADLR